MAATLRIFHASPPEVYTTCNVLNNVASQVTLITPEELEKDPSLGVGIKVAFWDTGCKSTMDLYDQGLLPDLKLICSHGAGVNHLPFDRLRAAGIQLTNTPRVLADCTADFAFALMLATGRQLMKGVNWAMHSGEKAPELFAKVELGQDVCFSTVGIVGMGGIGYKVAERAKAFNMKILYHNRNQRSTEDEAAVGAKYYSNLMEMLPLCDFVVICCPLNEQTTGLFKTEQFSAMKSTTHLINVARGAVVDTDSLVQALKSGSIGAAGLDVTAPEPLPAGHPLLSMENVVIAPHWGTATVQTRARMLQLMIDNAKAFTEGKPLLTEYKF